MDCYICARVAARANLCCEQTVQGQRRAYRIFSGGNASQKHREDRPSVPPIPQTETTDRRGGRRSPSARIGESEPGRQSEAAANTQIAAHPKRAAPNYSSTGSISTPQARTKPLHADELEAEPKKHVPRYQRDQNGRTYFPKARIDTAAWSASTSNYGWAIGSAPIKPRPAKAKPTSLESAKVYLRQLKAEGKYVAPPSDAAVEEIRQLQAYDPKTYTTTRLAKLYGMPQPAMLVLLDRLRRQTPEQLRQSREAEMKEWEAMPADVRANLERRAAARRSLNLLELLEARKAKGEELVPAGEMGKGTDRALEEEKTDWAVPPDDAPRRRPDWLQKRFDQLELENAKASST